MKLKKKRSVRFWALVAFALLLPRITVLSQEVAHSNQVDRTFAADVRPLLKQYCGDCHTGDEAEAEVDLAAFASMGDVRRDLKAWQKVAAMLESREMPPKDSDQPSDAERALLQKWVRDFLTIEAQARAGDPGPVVLRRLSNAEYTYTLRDLTGIKSLDPAREFPIDGAAGEGFTNTGNALVMSPSLVQKYLAAAKEVAQHAVLVPDGVRFSKYTTERDWTDERLASIQRLYAKWADDDEGKKVELQGLVFDTDQGGKIPLERYLSAMLVLRDAIASGQKSFDTIADQRGLNAKYLRTLYESLIQTDSKQQSFLPDRFRSQWLAAKPNDAGKLADEIRRWQASLWKFNTIGHIGRAGGPRVWMEPQSPIRSEQEFRIELPETYEEQDITVRFSASAVEDAVGAHVLWKNARLEDVDRPPLPLRYAAGLDRRIETLREESLASVTGYLAAITQFESDDSVSEFAKQHKLNETLLRAWLDYLGVGEPSAVEVTGHFTEKMLSVQGYGFVTGWGSGATPSIIANSSDETVNIPGSAPPHSVLGHPSPTLFAAAGWQSPVEGDVSVEAFVADAHTGCGNGQQWAVQHRTGRQIQNLSQGEFNTQGKATMPPKKITVRKGDLVSFVLGPRGSDHGCDLTHFNLTIAETDGSQLVWDLAKDVSPIILAANPHDDHHGNKAVWHFYKGPVADAFRTFSDSTDIPAESLLAKWREERDLDKRSVLSHRVQELVLGPRPNEEGSPDVILYDQLHALADSIDHGILLSKVDADVRFGKHPAGAAVEPSDLITTTPSVTDFRLPAKIAAGRTLVVRGRLNAADASTQLKVSLQQSSDDSASLPFTVLAVPGGAAERRLKVAFDEFRQLFPPALCYARIVPIDEVVTLTLFYRQDEQLKRLMLDDQESANLDRMWDELLYISQEPLKYQVAFEQLREFSTQDRPDLVEAWKVHIQPANDRADAFRQRLIDTEPAHLQAVVELADRAWRRALTDGEKQRLRDTYHDLRRNELPHDESIRLTIARVLTAPAFLYRLEKPGPGTAASPVASTELASRLSYFLWSSTPDNELIRVAQRGELLHESTIVAQTRQMLRDPLTRRLAIHFACQWLHVRDFDQNDEKNEKLYPEFATMRGHMYEETVQFFEDMFRNDGSILGLLDADHTFLNEQLARHYGVDHVSGADWRKVKGMREQGRGGVLGMATVLASLSGASRTSPILRGNWVSETLLGQRLPRPPANVPQLPEKVPSGGTARQLIEQHSSVPECAKCHARIDPFGFALEQFDAIGRTRDQVVDTKTKLFDGKTIEGLSGLREYLANHRRDDVVRQFCKKLLGYSLGREVQLSDEPWLSEIQRKLAENDYRFSIIVEEIVKSPQFRNIRGIRMTDE